MDIYCTRCGEPWDMDTLWDIADENDITYNAAHKLFIKQGCAAVDPGIECSVQNKEVSAMYAVLADLLGDDVDGIAASLEDFEYMHGGFE